MLSQCISQDKLYYAAMKNPKSLWLNLLYLFSHLYKVCYESWPNIPECFDFMTLPYLNTLPWFLWQKESRLDNKAPAMNCFHVDACHVHFHLQFIGWKKSFRLAYLSFMLFISGKYSVYISTPPNHCLADGRH